MNKCFLQKQENQELSINPLTPNVKEQILLSCPHTFHIKFTLGISLILMTSGIE